jgi:hypothetical protein
MDRSILDTDILSEVLKRRNDVVVRRAEEYLIPSTTAGSATSA